MKVLVCGGRHYKNREHVEWVLAKVAATVIIEPGTLGAPHYASDWARRKGFEVRTFRMNSREHGLQSGAIRNQQMLQEQPDLVIVFPDSDYVSDIISQARTAGIEVLMAETVAAPVAASEEENVPHDKSTESLPGTGQSEAPDREFPASDQLGGESESNTGDPEHAEPNASMSRTG